jgi:hypothetical protein
MIKDAIKNTKLTEKNTAAAHSMAMPSTTPPSLYHSPTDGFCRTRGGSMDSTFTGEFDFNSMPSSGVFVVPMLPTVHMPFDPFSSFTPFDVNVKTEQTLYLDNVERRRDSTIMTSCFQPNSLSPDQSGTDLWVQRDHYEHRQEMFPDNSQDTTGFDVSSQILSPNELSIHVPDSDMYLFDYFCLQILPVVFPIRSGNGAIPTNYQIFLNALHSNNAFLHCCLSIAAIQISATNPEADHELLTRDFDNHMITAVTEMVTSMNSGHNLDQVLEVALALIYLRNLVGNSTVKLGELPWTSHFDMATSIVTKNALLSQAMESDSPIPLNLTIASWIDILGATMHGKTPKFAHFYREKNINSESLGLSELMGCDDKIMFLISEIACLEELKGEGMDQIQLCMHIGTLGTHLNNSESGSVAPCLTPEGLTDPAQLSVNITSIFRFAARIYLCSLFPDFDRSQPNIQHLVNLLTSALDTIPAGQFGYDRALVWPLLIAGWNSLPGSELRSKLATRAHMMGESGQLGSFARMYEVLTEVWRQNDEGAKVHWRDVLKQQNWDHLLI